MLFNGIKTGTSVVASALPLNKGEGKAEAGRGGGWEGGAERPRPRERKRDRHTVKPTTNRQRDARKTEREEDRVRESVVDVQTVRGRQINTDCERSDFAPQSRQGSRELGMEVITFLFLC